MEEMKYKTTAALQQAYISGELSVNHDVLTVDNDDTSVYHEGEPVFRMDPETLLEQALDLLGIPSEHV